MRDTASADFFWAWTLGRSNNLSRPCFDIASAELGSQRSYDGSLSRSQMSYARQLFLMIFKVGLNDTAQ